MKRAILLAFVVIFTLFLAIPGIKTKASTLNWFDSPLELKLVQANLDSPSLNYWNIPCNNLRHEVYYHTSSSVINHAMDDCVTPTSYGSTSVLYGLTLAGTDTSYKFTTPTGAIVTGFMAPIPGSDDVIFFNGDYMYIYQDLPENIKPIYRLSGIKASKIDHYQLTNNLDYSIMVRYEDGSFLNKILDGSFSFASDGHNVVVNQGQYQVLIDTWTMKAKRFGSNTNLPYFSTPVTFTTVDSTASTALIGATRDETIYRLYNLNNCQPNSNASLPDICQNLNLWDYLKDIPDFNRVISANFVTNNSIELYVLAGKSGVKHIDKYDLSIAGQEDTKFGYLALGDSFASGEGARDYRALTDTKDNHCHISEVSYPYLIKKALSLTSAESVTCSGAKMKDILYSNEDYYNSFLRQSTGKETGDFNNEIIDNFLAGYRNQETFVKKYKPKAATLSIGGNDIDFGGIIHKCVGWYTTCYSEPQERSQLANTIKNQFEPLVDTYNKIIEDDPDVQLYIIGYPEIVAPNGNCAANVHLNTQEIKFAHDLTTDLNKVIELAAQNIGAHYVDVTHALYGHRLCETTPQDVAVNGLTVGNDIGIGAAKFIGNESYHPNAFGHFLLSQAILSDTKDFTVAMPEPQPETNVDNMSSLLGEYDSPQNNAIYQQDNLTDSDLVVIGSSINSLVKSLNYFLNTGDIFQITLHSTPITIGSASALSTTSLRLNATIPNTTEPGYHTIHITGSDIDNNPVDIYKTILVAASENDVDGDGIPNTQDKCNFVQPADIDVDQDGIDDACDGYIGTKPINFSTDYSSSSISAAVVRPKGNSDMEIHKTGKETTKGHNIVSQVLGKTKATADIHKETTAVDGGEGGYSMIIKTSVLIFFIFFVYFIMKKYIINKK